MSLIGALYLLAASSGVQAASIEINPNDIQVVAGGDSFTVTVDAVGFTTGAASGGFKLSWDSSILNLVSTPTFSTAMVAGGLTDSGLPFTNIAVGAGSIDVSFSSCTFLNIGACPTLAGDFTILDNLTFAVDPNWLGPTTDAVLSTTPIATTWFDTASVALDPQPIYGTATITVSAVPVPAAVWLFGSGLIGLVGIARRRTPRSV